MKRTLLLFLIGWTFLSFGQTEEAFVYFTNKPNAPYFLNNPLEMLSQRALERRQNQNIPLDITDAPLHLPYINQIENSVLVLAQSKWLNAVYVRGDYQVILTLNNLSFVENIEFVNKSLNSQGRKSTSIQKSLGAQKSLEIQENFLYGDSANQIQLHNGEFLHQQG